MEQVKDLITLIARSMVDHPEQVSVKEIDGANTVVLELTVSKVDLGKVIGKHGQNVMAIRTIMNAMTAKTRRRFLLQIVE